MRPIRNEHVQSFIAPAMALFLFIGGGAMAQPVLEESVEILPDDGEVRDNFGVSVAIDGARALIGAIGVVAGEFDAGATYVYRLQGDQWVREQMLSPRDAEPGEWFGFRCAINGESAFIANRVGSVYFYRLMDGLWLQTQKVTEGSNETCFGCTLDSKGRLALIGAFHDDRIAENAGIVYAYHWDGIQWNEVQRFVSSDTQAGDQFGSAVAISGNFAVIGAEGADDLGDLAGAAYIYYWDGRWWNEVAKLLPSDGEPGDAFGRSAAMSGGVAMVSSREEAYAFRSDGAAWREEQKLVRSDNEPFGNDVALEGGRAVIGSHRDADSTGAGFVFEWNGSQWEEIYKLVASDGTVDDLLAEQLAQSGNRILLGARGHDHIALDAGAVYAYHFDPQSREFILNVFGDCPGPGSVQAVGATPGGVVALVYALAMGSVEIPPGRPCAGTALGLDPSARLAGAMRADEDGAIVRDTPLPAAACGRVFVQAVDIASCAVSNVVAVE